DRKAVHARKAGGQIGFYVLEELCWGGPRWVEPEVSDRLVVSRHCIAESGWLDVELGDVVLPVALGRGAKHHQRFHRGAQEGSGVPRPAEQIAFHLVKEEARGV